MKRSLKKRIQKTILTTKQLDFLELAQAQKFIAKKFYLTGGTALSQESTML